MNAKENADVVRKWLKEDNWVFEESSTEDRVCFKLRMLSDVKLYRGYEIALYVRDRDVNSHFYPPVSIAEENRAAVGEYVNRINYIYRRGKITMDCDDGEIRHEMCKDAISLYENLSDTMDDLIGFPQFVLDKYMRGLVEIILGLKSPRQAFLDAEKNPDTDPMPTASADDKSTPEHSEIPVVPKCPPAEESPKKKRCTSSAELHNYSLRGMNIKGDIPLPKIVKAVKRFIQGKRKASVDHPRLNILLSGVPGSGKTAFVKFLADRVGAPLHVIRASDILSRYVGETEKSIASVFAKAKEEHAILFFDEIDSLLMDRRGARQSWEVTQVNELLQRMEEFGGVVIGATNFTENLDPAVIRRFTFKLQLDYLTDEGKEIFFNRYFHSALSDDERACLKLIDNLTPGDFRTVRENLFYLSSHGTNAERIAALRSESESKGGRKMQIGFNCG